MPFHLAAGLTLEAASRICSQECRALCCRGPLYLRLTAGEVPAFKAHAAALDVRLELAELKDGTGTVSFLEHAGEHCPMLDSATSVCRIYEDRPERCRSFPEAPRAECAISGWEAE